jgi:single-stranded DNA-binding protein
MIQITITGNLGADAERKQINDRTYIAFRMAVKGRRDTTTWVSVLYRDSDKLLQYLKKGQSVLIIGEPSFNLYVNKEQRMSLDISVFANTFELTGAKDTAQVSTQPVQENPSERQQTGNNGKVSTQPIWSDLVF